MAARLLRSLCAGACLLVAQLANAGAIDKLHQFLESTRTVRADFAQTVVARNGRQGQVSSGVMIISRPGKFRWQIDKPYAQLLVGDGEKIWIHDPDLRQVTVRKAGPTLGGTPAALLAGDSRIEKDFSLREAGEREGGVGLGLALVRSIAQRHGGSVTCDNRVGGGARFTLRLALDAPRGATK